MLSNAYFLAKFRFDTAENEPAKKFAKFSTKFFWRCLAGGLDREGRGGPGGDVGHRVLRRAGAAARDARPACGRRPVQGGGPMGSK